MGLISDLKILYRMAVKPIRGRTHQERLESFYSGQARGYDDFRKRLLQGRKEMWQHLAARVPPQADAIDMGGGTAANLEFIGESISSFRSITVVDLSPSLLAVARQRIADRGWGHVSTVEADATAWQPPEPVDLVTFSYSLTMIPDWFAAIDNARRMLKPGGLIGVVDFYVSRKYPEAGRKRHAWLTSVFWPIWFRSDNVFPSPDHVPYLHRRFEPLVLEEHRARIPYFPTSRVPYYIFVGRKPETLETPGE